jgi:hypothetical protein
MTAFCTTTTKEGNVMDTGYFNPDAPNNCQQAIIAIIGLVSVCLEENLYKSSANVGLAERNVANWRS